MTGSAALRYLGSRLRSLPRDEGGQSAMFAVVTLMLMVIVVGYTYNVGITVSQRVRLQNAADAAAFSGATVEANALSAIAWLNNSQTYLHSRLQEHMLDVVTYTTASALVEYGRQVKGEAASNKEKRDGYITRPFPHFIPIPALGLSPPKEHFGQMKALRCQAEKDGQPPATNADGGPLGTKIIGLNEAFGGTLYSKLLDKYNVTARNGTDVVNYTKSHVFADARKWIADQDKGIRRGEMWIKQLSVVAAAIAKALPDLIRNEVIYQVAANASPATCIAIFPEMNTDPGKTDSIPFKGEVALAKDDHEDPKAFFKYDYYGPRSNLARNRFLMQSRKQAAAQKFDFVASGAIKPDIAKWWDEWDGRAVNNGYAFDRWLMCWNDYDRYWVAPKTDSSLYENGDTGGRANEGRCGVGYMPGEELYSDMCRGTVATDNDAADGHFHAEHGHAHSDKCKREWGGMCIGIFGFWCLAKCGILEAAGRNHHMQYLNHEWKFHWDGTSKDKNGLGKAPPEKKTHIWCNVAISNRKSSPSKSVSQAKSQMPDLIPGMRSPKICFFCRFTTVWIGPIGPFPVCSCGKCFTPSSTNAKKKTHSTKGCRPGLVWEYFVIWWPWRFFQNWSGMPSGFPGGRQKKSPAPGHWWTEADWEARWSGDKWYYDPGYLDLAGAWSDGTKADPPTISLGGPLSFMDGPLNAAISGLFTSFLGPLKNIFGLFNNLKVRQGHHGIMACPLCHKKCSVCSKFHSGKAGGNRPGDKDADQRADVAMNFHDACNKHDSTQLGFDVDAGALDNPGMNWRSNFAADRFVRGWWAPRNSSKIPQTSYAPTVMITENLMRHGVTVALSIPHKTFFFGKFFGERSSIFAVATARAGFIERGTPAAGSPPQIITGAGEKYGASSKWNLDRVWSEFIDDMDGNLYYANWGAKLVSTRHAILHNRESTVNSSSRRSKHFTDPSSASRRLIFRSAKEAEKGFWECLGNTYCYNTLGQRINDRFCAAVHGGENEQYKAAWRDFYLEYLKSRDALEGLSP